MGKTINLYKALAKNDKENKFHILSGSEKRLYNRNEFFLITKEVVFRFIVSIHFPDSLDSV